MKYDPYYRFVGHLGGDDPRTNLHGAGGCVWPTVPAYRYLLTSDNPTGPFQFLSTVGLLVQFASGDLGHDLALWLGPWNPLPGVTCTAFKSMEPSGMAWRWTIGIKVPTCPSPAWGYFGPFYGVCNVDQVLGNIQCILPSIGETGSDLQMRQCEHDATGPPYDWP